MMAKNEINTAVWDDDIGKDHGIMKVQKGDKMKQKQKRLDHPGPQTADWILF